MAAIGLSIYSGAPAPLPFSTAPLSYSAGLVSYAAPQSQSYTISEGEGQAPEGTPLSAALCQHLGVPIGTIWGLPSGQRRSEEASQTITAQQFSDPNVTPHKSNDKPPGTQV